MVNYQSVMMVNEVVVEGVASGFPMHPDMFLASIAALPAGSATEVFPESQNRPLWGM